MNPLVLRPDKKYRTKLLIISSIVVLAVMSVMFCSASVDMIDTDGGIVVSAILVFALLLTLLLGIVFLLVFAYYNSLRYEIYEEEVIVYLGIITKTVKHVPFRTITNLSVVRGPVDRMLGLGSLAIQTAGASGTTNAEETLVGLSNVDEVYATVVDKLRRFKGAMSPDQSGTDSVPRQAAASMDNSGLLAEILAELRALREDMKRS